MSTERMRWFGYGVPLVLLIGLGIAVCLHVGLGRGWSELVVPIGAYVGIQLGTYICMFWARNRARSRGDYKPAVALIGLYGWGTGLLVIYYGTKWALLTRYGGDDLEAFSVFMIVVVAITFGLFSLLKGRLKSHE
jgi:hypothetical protein